MNFLGVEGAEVPSHEGCPLTQNFFSYQKINVTLKVLKSMWRAKGKNNKIQLSFKYRIYPTREEKLLKVMQVEAKVYNALLDAIMDDHKMIEMKV